VDSQAEKRIYSACFLSEYLNVGEDIAERSFYCGVMAFMPEHDSTLPTPAENYNAHARSAL
jgi:hypothetical protein